MKMFLTNTFKRLAKKIHPNQLKVLEEAIEYIGSNPMEGELKSGDLAGIRVYKFRIQHQLILLAYQYDEESNELMLLSFAPHENFYKNLRNQLR